MKKSIVAIMAVAVVAASAISSIATWQLTKPAPVQEHTKEDYIADFYKTETYVSVSPHTLRQEMDKGNTGFLLVDLRSAGEYKQEHITGAVNIDATKGDKDKIIEQFKALPKDKVIVTYCYTYACMLSRQVGNMLAEKGIYVKHLNIGWVQWRYEWKSWNSPGEWDTTKPEDYVTSGDQPGVAPKRTQNLSTCTNAEAELGC